MKLIVLAFIVIQGQFVFADTTIKDLDGAIAKSNWDEACEISHEILKRNPNSSEAKLKGAYALFQKGYSNSALILLRTLSTEEWKKIPQGRDRFVEVVSLFQKKIPLSFLPWRLEQMDVQESSSYMTDELRFLKGKAAYEHGHSEEAKKFLEAVNKNSRFNMPSHYLLGSIYADSHDYPKASAQFAEVLQPAVLDQSSEFWKDVGAQTTSHWGSNFKVMLDTELISKNEQVAELSMLALARIAYASKDYETALKRYSDIPTSSVIHSRSVLEKVWTLWALNRHGDAQKVAADLSLEGATFSTVEAHILRALVLTDSGQTEEARKEIQRFDQIYARSKAALTEFQERSLTQLLPEFIQFDLDQDAQLQALKTHQKSLDSEISGVRGEDAKLFPVYSHLSSDLEVWKSKSVQSAADIVHSHVAKRIADLDRLNLQSKLFIVAETYLEDREQLKSKIKTLKITEEKIQGQYDEELIDLLNKAIEVVAEPFSKLKGHHARIEFRQAELLWELGTAKLILGQAKNSKNLTAEGTTIREKALGFVRDLAANEQTFAKYNQVLFFKGFSEIELNQTSEAIKTFHLYVQKFPTHEHVPDAYRILGDIEFDENRFAEAEKYYKKVLEFPDSPLVGYALYKLGWCAYNEKNFGRALLALEKAYQWTSETTENKLLGCKKKRGTTLFRFTPRSAMIIKQLITFSVFLVLVKRTGLSISQKSMKMEGSLKKLKIFIALSLFLSPTPPKIWATCRESSNRHLNFSDGILSIQP